MTTTTYAATNPVTGDVVTRSTKTMPYTHALVLHTPGHDAYTIAAGTYNVPAKRIRGYRVAAHTTTVSQDYSRPAQSESWYIVSFHTSRQTADKAGRSAVSRSASSRAQSLAVYGEQSKWVGDDQYRIVEVEVVHQTKTRAKKVAAPVVEAPVVDKDAAKRAQWAANKRASRARLAAKVA